MSKKCFSLFVLALLALVAAVSFLLYVLTSEKPPRTGRIQENFISTEKPTPTSKSFNKFKYHIPKFMLELYRNNRAGDQGVDVVRSLIPKQAESYVDSELFRHVPDSHLLIFELPIADKDEKFIGAELKLLTIVDSPLKNVNFERILEIASFQTPDNIKSIQQLTISQSNNTWVSFNVTETVRNALQTSTNLKIFITITALKPKIDDFNLKLSLMPQMADVEHDYPVLILSYRSTDVAPPTTARQKRNLEEEYEEETNNIWEDDYKSKTALRTRMKRVRNSCRKRPLYVNFAEIEYDVWIVQPTGYEAYQCQGRCFYPVAEHLNPTKHAIVQALVHSVAPARATRSCCVPTRLDSISILYVDGAGVLTYRFAYKDMVVAECGCR